MAGCLPCSPSRRATCSRSLALSPHVEVSLAPRMYRDPIDSINSSRYVASAIRLTSKYVATVCSAVGVTSWPLKKTQHYVLSNGMYLTQADQSWVIKADLPKDVCIGDIAAVPNQVPSVSIGQSIAVARGDAVFAFVDPMSAKSLAFGIVEETYPADPGYGQLLTVRFSSPIGIGSGSSLKMASLSEWWRGAKTVA